MFFHSRHFNSIFIRSANKPFNLERSRLSLFRLKSFFPSVHFPPPPPDIFTHNRDIREDQKDSYSLEKWRWSRGTMNLNERRLIPRRNPCTRRGRDDDFILPPFSKKKRKSPTAHTTFPPDYPRTVTPHFPRFPQRPAVRLLRWYDNNFSTLLGARIVWNPGGGEGGQVMLFQKLFEECSRNLTIPSPRLWTTQGRSAVDPDWAEITVEFSVPKLIGSVGGRSMSNGFMLASNEFPFVGTISAVAAVGYSEKIGIESRKIGGMSLVEGSNVGSTATNLLSTYSPREEGFSLRGFPLDFT